MTVYVDKLRSWPGKAKNLQAQRYFGDGKSSCHMTADTTKELIAFARQIGCNATWMDRDGLAEPYWHFDLTPGMRAKAIKAGAINFDILSERYGLQPEDRVPCKADTDTGACGNSAIRECALCEEKICHTHSHHGEMVDERMEYLCFECATR